MFDFNVSAHASTRMNQRGMREPDIALILQCGSQIDDAVFFLSRKDANREIQRRKLEIRALERLRNRKVVTDGKTVVTCYPSSKFDQKRTLRRGRESE